MRNRAHSLSPVSPPLPEKSLGESLHEVLARAGVIRVEVPGQLPYWLTVGPAQKQGLVERGAPPARV
jgi:hypothetical protein